MHDEDLMGIGRFARLSGVSVHALRHYDEVGLLAPAEVDGASGYRRYRVGQIPLARLILALRCTDLPIDGIRQVLDSGPGDVATAVLERHRDRLERQRSRLTAQLKDVNRFLEGGLEMPVVQAGCRPVQIKIAVESEQRSAEFYQALIRGRYDVAQRTAHGDYSSFIFGEYGRDDFFLLWLLDDHARLDLPGRSNFGLLVDDLDAAHRRALAAGAAEAVAPRDDEGMPRHSAVTDPSGNWVGLFQGGMGCRPVQLMIAVEDAAAAAAFYQEAFGLPYRVGRRTREHEYLSLVFGEYGRDDFFLLWLLDDPGRVDWPGPANFGFLVDDLDASHARALAAGAAEISAPHDTEGMPRHSQLRDPSGNWIGLAQG
jgi:DNA-binding transcriptional MerR regulator